MTGQRPQRMGPRKGQVLQRPPPVRLSAQRGSLGKETGGSQHTKETVVVTMPGPTKALRVHSHCPRPDVLVPTEGQAFRN